MKISCRVAEQHPTKYVADISDIAIAFGYSDQHAEREKALSVALAEMEERVRKLFAYVDSTLVQGQ